MGYSVCAAGQATHARSCSTRLSAAIDCYRDPAAIALALLVQEGKRASARHSKQHEWTANDLCSMLCCYPVQTCAVTRAADDRRHKFHIRLAVLSFGHAHLGQKNTKEQGTSRSE